MTKSHFLTLLILQLCFPAIVYLLFDYSLHQRIPNLAYLLPSYLFLAMPHIIVALFAFIPNIKRIALIWLLTLLNSLLIAFYFWILSLAPHDSGLAGLLYIPLWISVLITTLLLELMFKFIRYSTL